MTELHFPFQPLPSLNSSQRTQLEKAALEFNDRYLEDFVESLNFCPFAKEGRKRQETTRYVHLATELDSSPLVELMHKIAADESIAVAQVIFPGISVEPRNWMEFCTALTDLSHKKLGGRDVLALAALHPELSYRPDTVFSIIPLFRRSPDPTIQWVRLSSLDKLYKGKQKGSTFIDPSEIAALLDGPAAAKPLYDKVAESNAAVARRIGIDKVELMLQTMSDNAKEKYESIFAGADTR